MAWWSVHAIYADDQSLSRTKGNFVAEYCFLVEAPSSDEAFEKGTKVAREWVNNNPELFFAGEPVKQTFQGIRKVIGADENSPIKTKLEHGEELTYSYFEANSIEDVKKFVDGEEVTLCYWE